MVEYVDALYWDKLLKDEFIDYAEQRPALDGTNVNPFVEQDSSIMTTSASSSGNNISSSSSSSGSSDQLISAPDPFIKGSRMNCRAPYRSPEFVKIETLIAMAGHPLSSLEVKANGGKSVRKISARTWTFKLDALAPYRFDKKFKMTQKLFFREANLCTEKLFWYIVLGACLYINPSYHGPQFLMAGCVLRNSHDPGLDTDTDPKHLVLMRILLTMCSNPVLKFVVLDMKTEQIHLLDFNHMKPFFCDPKIHYDEAKAESLYKDFILQVCVYATTLSRLFYLCGFVDEMVILPGSCHSTLSKRCCANR